MNNLDVNHLISSVETLIINNFLQTEKNMKSVLFALLVAATLAACGKKEEVKPAETPAAVLAPVSTPAASEPAKTEEVKK